MRDAFVDVTFEVPEAELRAMRNPGRYVFEKLRDAADRLCEESGARLRTDRRPELHMRKGAHKITHVDHVLFAARFPVTVPETVAPLR